jgi:hypothetical protein
MARGCCNRPGRLLYASLIISLIINNLDDFREERMKDKMERLGITDKLDERLSTRIK